MSAKALFVSYLFPRMLPAGAKCLRIQGFSRPGLRDVAI